MPAKFSAIVWCVFVAGLSAAGCSSSPSISTWQRNVERYVADKGEPNALRDVTLAGTQRGFATIGGINPGKSTDVNGVLLGHQVIDNRPWFVYLVGLVPKQKVADIHLAAVSFGDGKPRWAISAKDPKAVGLYRHHNEGLWKPQHAKEKPPATYTTFPREVDSFDLAMSSSTLEATHAPSGAKWTVDTAKAKPR